MIKEFVKKWEENKNNLREHLEVCEYRDVQYEYLVESLFKYVINDSLNNYDTKKMTVIDHGDYQVMLIFIVPKDTYQPCESDYVYATNYYGSCSGCDTLQAIQGGSSKEKVIDDLMTLCLHLLQGFKRLGEE